MSSTASNSGEPDLQWAPQEVFDSILQYAVIPTFDLILDTPNGILLVRRQIEPYKNRWALPGLRMLKGETPNTCIERIGRTEVGLELDAGKKEFVGQAVKIFRDHHNRQDLSTCYAFRIDTADFRLNPDHLSDSLFVRDVTESPGSLGDLYRQHLECYLNR